MDNTANLNVSSIAWQGRAPCRLRVSSLDKSGVRVGQTDTAGLAAYVFEVWSADHLTGAAMVSRDSPGVFQKANHHLEVWTSSQPVTLVAYQRSCGSSWTPPGPLHLGIRPCVAAPSPVRQMLESASLSQLLCGMPASKLIGVPLSTIITASGAQSADPLVVSSGSRRSIATTLSHADGMSIQSVLDAASKETARGSFGMLLRAKEDRGALDVVQLLRQTDGVLERTENARKKGNDARAEVERAEGVEVEPDSASDDSDASEGSDRGAASGAASVSGASAATGWTEAMIEGGGASTARQEETMRREIEDAAVRRKQLRDVLESTGLIASVRSMLTRILALAIMAAVMNAGVSAAVLAVLFQVFAELSRHGECRIDHLCPCGALSLSSIRSIVFGPGAPSLSALAWPVIFSHSGSAPACLSQTTRLSTPRAPRGLRWSCVLHKLSPRGAPWARSWVISRRTSISSAQHR